MIILIVGEPGTGKSELAENIVMEISGEDKKFYIATMIPVGEEGKIRVKRHRELRAGKGFETIEQHVDVGVLSGTVDGIAESTCLLECMSNLIGNEMHDDENVFLSDEELKEKLIEDVELLEDSCKNLVVVTNRFPLEDEGYDDDTRRFVKLTAEINDMLRSISDRVYELTEGEWILSENN